jgi:alanyl-tRNA synthetase
VSESALAAGIRRIEAITSVEAERMINEKLAKLDAINALLKNPADVVQAVEKLVEQTLSSPRNWRRPPRRR